jgi:malate dehydrogenase (quinone)
MLNLLEKAFPEQTKGVWNDKLHEIVRSYGKDLSTDPALLDQIRQYSSSTLGLNYTTPANLVPAKKVEKRSCCSISNAKYIKKGGFRSSLFLYLYF